MYGEEAKFSWGAVKILQWNPQIILQLRHTLRSLSYNHKCIDFSTSSPSEHAYIYIQGHTLYRPDGNSYRKYPQLCNDMCESYLQNHTFSILFPTLSSVRPSLVGSSYLNITQGMVKLRQVLKDMACSSANGRQNCPVYHQTVLVTNAWHWVAREGAIYNLVSTWKLLPLKMESTLH